MSDIATPDGHQDSWWISFLGRTQVWARLRLLEAGTAEVFDSAGNTFPYDSEDSARSALLDADFREREGLDEGDAAELGFLLDELTPPQGDDDARLLAQMIRQPGQKA
ncbi:MAG: hypothetical protein R3F22_07970 [Lysobacteraceae bacterium]